jgi:hypothetical protein
VTKLNLASSKAYVKLIKVNYFTSARGTTDVEVIKKLESGVNSASVLATGNVNVVSKVWGWSKHWFGSGKISEMGVFSIPPLEYETRATWIDVPPEIQKEVEEYVRVMEGEKGEVGGGEGGAMMMDESSENSVKVEDGAASERRNHSCYCVNIEDNTTAEQPLCPLCTAGCSGCISKRQKLDITTTSDDKIFANNRHIDDDPTNALFPAASSSCCVGTSGELKDSSSSTNMNRMSGFLRSLHGLNHLLVAVAPLFVSCTLDDIGKTVKERECVCVNADIDLVFVP